MYTHIYTYTYIHIHTHTVLLRTNVTKNAFGTLPEHNWNAFESRSCCYCDQIGHPSAFFAVPQSVASLDHLTHYPILFTESCECYYSFPMNVLNNRVLLGAILLRFRA